MPGLLSVTTVPQTHSGFLLPYAHHFRALGWRVDGLAAGLSACEPCIEAYDHVYDIEWSRNPFDPRNLTRAAARVRQIVQEGGYDIVHVHTPVASFVSRYALRPMHKKGQLQVIYTAHGFHFHRDGHPLKNLAFLGLEKLAGGWTDYLVVINREDEEDARKHKIVDPERIRYMPGIGIDLSQYNPERILPTTIQQLRQALEVDTDQVLFSMIAAFEPRKRHCDALDALAALHDPGVVLAFAGVGPLQAAMVAKAKDLGVAHQVRFLGFREDIPTIIAASRATLLPSEREGLPRSVMESMALGTPVIATDAKGNRDLLEEDVGILVPIGDHQAMARAMRYLLEHPNEARAMGERARQHIRAFDLQRIIEMHEALYEEALHHQTKIL